MLGYALDYLSSLLTHKGAFLMVVLDLVIAIVLARDLCKVPGPGVESLKEGV